MKIKIESANLANLVEKLYYWRQKYQYYTIYCNRSFEGNRSEFAYDQNHKKRVAFLLHVFFSLWNAFQVILNHTYILYMHMRLRQIPIQTPIRQTKITWFYVIPNTVNFHLEFELILFSSLKTDGNLKIHLITVSKWQTIRCFWYYWRDLRWIFNYFCISISISFQWSPCFIFSKIPCFLLDFRNWLSVKNNLTWLLRKHILLRCLK